MTSTPINDIATPLLPMEELMYDGATLAAGACALPDAPMAMQESINTFSHKTG